ncbi:MAG: Lrp/AsnC family transcriptional regulator [Thermoplasmata archaeon]|jgi:DNA-binding Lrp family transcriptional regulator
MMVSDEEEQIVSNVLSGFITAIVSLKVSTEKIDDVAKNLKDYVNVEDLFLVTGDTDIIMKVKFLNYKDLKEFIVDKVGRMEGVQDTSTMIVVASYKEKGILITEK